MGVPHVFIIKGGMFYEQVCYGCIALAIATEAAHFGAKMHWNIILRGR